MVKTTVHLQIKFMINSFIRINIKLIDIQIQICPWIIIIINIIYI